MENKELITEEIELEEFAGATAEDLVDLFDNWMM